MFLRCSEKDEEGVNMIIYDVYWLLEEEVLPLVVFLSSTPLHFQKCEQSCFDIPLGYTRKQKRLFVGLLFQIREEPALK